MVLNTMHNVVRIASRYDETREEFLSDGEEFSYIPVLVGCAMI